MEEIYNSMTEHRRYINSDLASGTTFPRMLAKLKIKV